MKGHLGRISMECPVAWGLLAALIVMVVPFDVFAAEITITQTGTGSGTIGGTPFTSDGFTITSVGDTGNRASYSGGFFISSNSASISIAGLGTYQFITATGIFNNTSGAEPGFTRAPLGGLDLFDGPENVAFDDWDMLTSIGPITGTAELLQWQKSPVVTSGGTLVFQNANGVPTTFQATVAVPEPSTFSLLAVGAIGMLGYVWRRRRPFAQSDSCPDRPVSLRS